MDSQSSFAISSFNSDVSSLSVTTFVNVAHDSLDYHRENNRRKLANAQKRKMDDENDLVELLIHTSAPSAAKDDTLYRKQAEAILGGFEVARRVEIEGPRKRRKLELSVPQSQTPSERRGSIHSQTAYLISFSSDDGLEATVGELTSNIEAAIKSPSQKRSSPTTPIIEATQGNGKSSLEPWQQLDEAFQLDSPIHNYILTEDSWELSSHSIPDSYQAPISESPISQQEALLQADCKLQSSLEVLVSGEASNQASPSQPKHHNDRKPPEPTKPFIYGIPPPSENSLSQLSSISGNEATPQKPGLSTPYRTKGLPLFNPYPELPLCALVREQHIISPPPETNSHLPLVTPYLEKLYERKICEYYRPYIKKRDLRDMERGCWVVDTSAWTRKEKLEFWEQIKPGIEYGRCGAVTVFIAQGNEEEQGKKGIGRNRVGDKVQVFCWGKAAQLIWAYLLIFSNWKTKTGMYWEDAGGDVVIRC